MHDLRSVGPALRPHGAPAPAEIGGLAGSMWEDAAVAAAAHAPYLARLLRRRPDLTQNAGPAWPEQLLNDALRTAIDIARDPPMLIEGMRLLRRAKDAVHLGAAIADLARAWPLDRVTGALTDFADASVRAALALASREMGARGELVPAPWDAPTGPAPGLIIIAMGKMGACELNYSSDIDVSVFFDAEALSAAKAREPRVAAVRLVAPFVRALEEVTEDGYVFRTDLRLRPDPSSTPVAVSIAAAEHYYQTLGQNWERAAFIKARIVGGDIACGRSFLLSLQPFIWRKHLDFAAIADVHSIKRQILSAHKSAQLGVAVFDVKLGRGGIRDIELFVQTQQLILGGRTRALRGVATLDTLDALCRAGIISPHVRDDLADAYVFFREIEHRIQMLEDAHTHDVPAQAEARGRLAALSGFETIEAFEAAVIARRNVVAEIDHELFGEDESLAAPEGSLIFTGVEDHSETLETIRKMGFADPATVSGAIRGWHHGRIRAMRAERARELLTTLTPRMLRAFARTGEPDQAFARFSTFFSGLSAGVQVLSLMAARPALLDLLARLFGLAPRLAETLAKRPALLDAMIEPHFVQALSDDAAGVRRADLAERLKEAATFEAKINVARRFKREEAFRIGVQVLEGQATAEAAGAAHADLAEACVAEMTHVALEEVSRLSGAAPGAFAVLALGKFGGRELAEGSDLDIMMLYDAADGAGGDFYTRVTQRLITALSAPTEEGELYDVDAQLRPSGSKGPVAVRLSSFERYYAEEAWTWELQALTRLRAVAGDAALGARAEEIARATLARPRDATKIKREVVDMRARMARERPAKSTWDLKLAPGGFVDVEFIAQALQLTEAAAHPSVLAVNTGEALDHLAAVGAIPEAARVHLVGAWSLYSDLQQALRVCVEGEFAPEQATMALQKLLARLGGSGTFEELSGHLGAAQRDVRKIFTQFVGPLDV